MALCGHAGRECPAHAGLQSRQVWNDRPGLLAGPGSDSGRSDTARARDYNRGVATSRRRTGAPGMDHSPLIVAQGPARPLGRRLARRGLLVAMGGALLWLAWVGYSQPGLLLQFANLRYCG